ncbi:hypothetical protein IEQ34_014153 [Dendrobium chrysotoxum]|uniref:Uncharacterized protein n=1 Tax=Dendrobium chrysotoxum TaxID=161865 RepID=A0AAV7GJF0_DENCH|nr:hypothetical protein IEQ34_014153 [Dendrobium chrysotoxum]
MKVELKSGGCWRPSDGPTKVGLKFGGGQRGFVGLGAGALEALELSPISSKRKLAMHGASKLQATGRWILVSVEPETPAVVASDQKSEHFLQLSSGLLFLVAISSLLLRLRVFRFERVAKEAAAPPSTTSDWKSQRDSLAAKNYLIGAFKSPCNIKVTFSDSKTRKQVVN